MASAPIAAKKTTKSAVTNETSETPYTNSRKFAVSVASKRR